jgi:transketolase
MKPVLRVAALMEQPVKFMWTHDAFRVGEDGPTHQPIEQEAQLRLLEKLNNHSGKSSMIALRPADSSETVAAWKSMMETNDRPTGLILSRQGIADLPSYTSESRLEVSMKLNKGGYILKDVEDPEVILLANGSEVSTLHSAIEELSKKYRTRIVSVPSEGLFREQSADYQAKVLPAGVPIFGMTAGLPVTLESLVRGNGTVYGMTHFGYSAPYTVLDEKFGYTAENVIAQVDALMSK